MKLLVLFFILLSLSGSHNYAQADPNILGQVCATNISAFDSPKLVKKELRRTLRERKELEKTATEMEQTLAVKEAAFLRYEYGIRSWLDDSPDRNIAAAVIAYLGPPADLEMRTSVEDSCKAGMTLEGKTVPWASFCELNDDGDPKFTSRLWSIKFREDGRFEHDVCASVHFIKPANFQLWNRYFGEEFGRLWAYNNHERRCAEGIENLAQSRQDFLTAEHELEIVQLQLDCSHILDQQLSRENE